MMNEELLSLIQKKLYDFSGIKIAETQKKTLSLYVEELAAKSGMEIADYCNALTQEHNDFPLLINHITVNETYFFREEKQFDILKKYIFPKFQGKKMNIWSGACSSGEEAISLLVLALSFNIDVQVFATDIDDNAINKLKSGIYTQYSFRTDGKKYHELLSPFYEKKGDKYIFTKMLLDRIQVCKYNLKTDNKLPFMEKMDLIFLRNVFIYFEKETRCKIAKNICSSLIDNGYLFFSMNEIGCLDESVIPPVVYKTNQDLVYFYIKGKNPGASSNEFCSKEIKKIQTKKHLPQLKERTTEYAFEKKVEVKKAEIKKQVVFDKVSAEINTKNFQNAKRIIEEINTNENKGFYYFLHGYIDYHADNKEISEKLFSSSEILLSDFWPTYFYHGMVLRDIGKKEKAVFCLKKCMELLDSSKTDLKYEFTLDCFSPKYIYSLCESMIKE